MSAIRFLFSHMRRAMMMLAALLSLSAFSINIPRESYSYDIHYRFGPINCRIGHGDVAFSVVNNQLRGTLQGASIPWQGKIYTVRDTLCADMRILEGQKFSREHVTRKIGWYFKPSEQALKSGRYDYYAPQSFRNTMGQGRLDASPLTMEAIDITADMIAMFYYFKEIDFADLTPGSVFTLPISSPLHAHQFVQIRYVGESEYEGTATYEVIFEYSYNGRPCQYPVTCRVARESRIPLLFSAELKIGHMEMRYAN